MSTTRTQSQSDPQSAQGPSAPAVHLVTFGCQMNKYDSSLVEGRFRRRGYRVTDSMGDADVILFNTCSVRDHAEERTYSWIGELKREKETRPELVLGVMGCMAQRAEEEIFGRAAHVDIVCGTRRFGDLPDMVEEVFARRANPEAFGTKGARLLDTEQGLEVEVNRLGDEYDGGLHAYLAVMRGCDLNCTYCIVPTTRGRVRSRPIADLVAEARWMAERGCKTLTLLGQTINSYGEDLPTSAISGNSGLGRGGRPSLADLLYALEEVDGLERVRMITLHPSYVTPEFAKAVARCSKVERFLPLPAQSGSDEILRNMRRGYTTDLYRKRIDILRNEVPDLELSSDWIVGFPGESEADFAASERFLEEIGFAVNYIFKYDPRPGTVSSDQRSDDIALAVKKERNARLLAAAEASGRKQLRGHMDNLRRVFFEDQNAKKPELLRGKTEHGLPISVPADPQWIGREAVVMVRDATAFGLGGEIQLLPGS